MSANSGIEQLLLKPQRLESNLSSHQMIKILDLLIEKALQPICAATDILQEWICELLPLVHGDSRRKVSSVPTEQLLSMGMASIFVTKKSERFRLINEMKLERGLAFMLLWKLYFLTENYNNYQLKYCKYKDPVIRSHFSGKMQEVEQRCNATRNSLGPALNQSSWWADHGVNYKSMIAEKFYKLAYQQASRAASSTNIHVDINDLYKNYLLALNRAIDKFSPDKGVLTSYIQYYFKDANINPDFSHQYGVSYSLPNSRRRELQKKGWMNSSGVVEQNISSGIEESLEIEDHSNYVNEVSTTQTNQRLRSLGKFREIGLIMLTQNVAYPLTDEEKRLQRESVM